MLATLRAWPLRRWLVVGGATIGYALLVAVPTDLVDTPAFGREVPPTWWAWPALVASSLLAGLLTATYVAAPSPSDSGGADRAARGGWAGGVLTFFAVGCPVCNKLVLLALGSAGAMTWFEPVQPLLQLAAVGVLVWALGVRLRGEQACPVR
jgi:hypothetical protein